MSIYRGDFTSANGDTYRIEITTNSGNATRELTLGANPFITEMSVEDDNIYSPIKGTAATIEFLLEDYIFNFYSENPIGTPVKLYNLSSGECEWSGYVTPQMFSQGFELGPNEIQVEAVDCLSVLEDLKFKSPEKNIVTFEDLFFKILSQVDVKYMFVSNNISLTGTAQTILDKLYISELNFFDKKDSDETDDDVCWTCKEVISEMCQYLGYVALMYKDNVYLVDYDAIKAGINTYYRYDIKAGIKSDVSIQIWDSHHIIGTDHHTNNATVSLDKIYNKVTVKADTYAFDDLDDSVNDINITDTNVEQFSTSGFGSVNYIWAEVFPADEDQSKAMDVWIDARHDEQQGWDFFGLNVNEENYYDFVAMKFISKENAKFWLYDKNWNDVTAQYNKAISHDKFRALNGGMFVKYFTKNLDQCKTNKNSWVKEQWNKYYKELKTNPDVSSQKYLDYCLDYSGINSISWSEAIIMNNFGAKTRAAESDWYKYPYYQIECKGSVIQGGENSALIIQGQFVWHPIGSSSDTIDSYPMEFCDYQLDKPNWINPNEDMFIPASVQWGNLWWNGTNWQNTQCGFKLNWLSKKDRDDNTIKDKDKTIDAWKCQKTVMQPQPITNTVTWRFGTSEEGHLIKIPEGVNLVGKPILTIYRPISGRVWKSRKDYYNGDKTQGIRWPWYFVALQGLKFKSIVGDPSYSDANKTDTVYTNELENDSITEMDEIAFKIHTYDGKENTFSAVAYNGGDNFVDKIYNRALANEEKTWYDFNGELATKGMRSEEHLIYKLVKQYTSPAKILECEIKLDTVVPYGLYTDTTLSGNYIVASFGTDYKNSYNNIKLLEKK